MGIKHFFTSGLLAAALTLGSVLAVADTIDPATYSTNLAPGESVTIRKTVVVEEGTATDARLDVHFLFDTSGSMGPAIDQAKTAASSILAALSGFGDVAVGVGVFSEGAHLTGTPPGSVINQNLTTDLTLAGTAINNVTLNNPDGGGDFPERGQDATKLAADNLTWRAGSSRFIVALGDASWKNDIVDDATAVASLTTANAELIGLRYGTWSFSDVDSDDLTFTESVEGLGGTVFAGGTTTSDIVNAITGAISGSLASYGAVTVGDLGSGLPGVSVSTICVTADIGTCDGSTAVGAFDRSTDRTFEFDVTFTAETVGTHVFSTHALVDGGIIATEIDTITVALGSSDDPRGDVPTPGVLALLAIGLLGMNGQLRRRRA